MLLKSCPVGLKERFIYPVLRAVQWIVDADLGGVDTAQDHRVLNERVPDLPAIPGRPGAHHGPRPIGLDPDFDRATGRESRVDASGGEAFATVSLRVAMGAGNG